MSTPYVGEIRLFAGNFAIRGWLLCQGQLVSIAQNQVLFSLLGTTYGGDGQTTFALPDLRSRVPLHQGTGIGQTNRVLGEIGGTETVVLTQNQLPSHTHQLIALTGNATLMTPANALPATPSTAEGELLYLSGTAPNPPAITDAPPNPASVSATGGNGPHNNLMPLLAMNYLIASEGIFPSQN